MNLDKASLQKLIREQLKKNLKESFGGPQIGMSMHPFDNELANAKDTGSQENAYDELADATIMEMVSIYNEDSIRKIIRFLSDRASQGPEGLGGRFSDTQIEDILLRVFETVEDKLNINLASYLPQDREHPKYMDMDTE